MIKEKIMRTLSTRTWNPLNFFNDTFESFFTPYYEKFDFMKTDITERDEAFLLEVELPGFDKKDITVEYQDKYLNIKAERQVVNTENEKVIRKERSVSCARNYYVGDIDETALKAKYENGILTVTIPKAQPKKNEKLGIDIE